ncbi:ABC transporter permease [Phototrophicus methaneseepsis]|uniref:ABC transporter permease n=2 Tax=Phototrophicus methaneseepsis TaxID=2710758 RepID=A0A7S8EDW2_9CHLR|nr:ABC transporter permease [Phototrophicus methaneseepsis]
MARPRSAETVSQTSGVFGTARKLWANYTIRTIVQAIFTIWLVITFIFFLVRLMPGNPVDVYVDYLMNQERITYEEAFARAASQFQFDPDAPVTEQYLEYMGQLVQGDLGESITSTGTKVLDQIIRFLPWTLFAVGLGLLVSFILGVVIGLLMAYYRNSWIDVLLSLISSILSAVPNYIWGLLILIIFGVQLHWFAIGELRGTYDSSLTPGFNLPFILSMLQHAFLPVLVYVSGTLGNWVLTMRNSTISVLGEDYVNVARARGLSRTRIATAYVGRNAALPMFTLLAINIGFVIGGSVIIEELFVYKGLGSFLYWSITQRDYTSMQGVLLIIVISVVFSNMLADLLYSWLDPRVRLGDN